MCVNWREIIIHHSAVKDNFILRTLVARSKLALFI